MPLISGIPNLNRLPGHRISWTFTKCNTDEISEDDEEDNEMDDESENESDDEEVESFL